jgi:hypothetical protein
MNTNQFHWKKDQEGNWVPPERIEAFVEWACTPRLVKDPKTVKLWAEANGWAHQTVKEWAVDERVRLLIRARLKDLNINDLHIQEVVDAMHSAAASGDVRAATLYLQYVQAFVPKQRVVVEDKRVSDMSDEEFERQVQALISRTDASS